MFLPSHFSQPLAGRYAVDFQVGAGASGVVYRATDLALQHPVALKILLQHGDGNENPAVREAELLQGIDHPGIVRILDAGVLEELSLPYLCMEWLDGQDLSTHQKNSPLSAREVLGIGVLIAKALAAAHERGLIHRDIKPANILLRRRSGSAGLVPELELEPVLTDFGIATKSGRTDLGGTPAYMSPEQARGDEAVDHRSDIYSLGATLFELLTGRPPHQGASHIATLARLATTPAPRLSSLRPDLSAGLDDAIAEMLETEPNDRPQSAGQVAELLAQCLAERPEPEWPPEEASSQLGAGTTRLVTTLVAVGFAEENKAKDAILSLRSQGAVAVRLGKEAVVAHLGVVRASGSEGREALAMGRRLAEEGASVGVASGRARLSARGDLGVIHPVGDVVDRAASLAREASRGQTLSDATTSELGRGRYEFQIRADGSAIVGKRLKKLGTERSGGAPFVGRETELAQILSAHQRARTGGGNVVIAVCGPPGIGKTRLQKEAVARLSSRADPSRVLVRRSEAYGKRHILGTAADILRALVELKKGAGYDDVERALAERVGPQTMSELSIDNQRLLAQLLGGDELPEGLSSKGSRDALWIAMTDLILRVLSNEALVLVMEDLQWADTESVLWLDHLLGRSSRHPLVLVACIRPEFWEGHSGRFASRDLVRIDLRPISQKSVRAIALAVLGDAATSAKVENIVSQAAGSPLFAEELARLVSLGQDSKSAPTIEMAIQASLDALSPQSRDALGRLSIFGQATWTSGLTALGLSSAEELMKELAGHEVLNHQSSSRFPGAEEYLFKHALVRDVAYASLTDQHRTELHEAAGKWLAQMNEDAAVVAGHLDLGGCPEEAAGYWEQAAQRALNANVLIDALNMAERSLAFAHGKEETFRRALLLDEVWSRSDPRAADRETAISALEASVHDEESQVRAQGARARYDDARGQAGDVVERLGRACTSAQLLGLTDELARCSAALASRAAYAGDLEMAEAEAQRLLDPALSAIRGARVDAYQTLAIVRQARGLVSAALEARRSAATAAREASLKERESTLTTNLGFALSHVGARQDGREALERGLAIAEHIGSAGATRHAQMNLLGWASLYGNDRRLEGLLGETRAEADAAATGYWAAPDRANLGILFYRGVELLRTVQGPSQARAQVLLKMAAESYDLQMHLDVLPVALGMWAEAERALGRPREAQTLAARAAALIEQGAHSLLNEAPIFLTLHKACLDLGDDAGAEAAIAASVRPLLRRLSGLLSSPYARMFLTEIPHNAELISAIDAMGSLPEAVRRVLTGDAGA